MLPTCLRKNTHPRLVLCQWRIPCGHECGRCRHAVASAIGCSLYSLCNEGINKHFAMCAWLYKSQVDCMVAQEVGFRPSKLRVDVAMRAVSLVLCNDKLSTYGAPDVLQVSVDQLDAHFSRDRCFADRPSNQARPCADNCRTNAPCCACSWLSVLIFISSCIDWEAALRCEHPVQSAPIPTQHALQLVELRLLLTT